MVRVEADLGQSAGRIFGRNLVAERSGGRQQQSELLHAGIVTHEQQARILVVGPAHQSQQMIDRRKIDGLVELGVDRGAIALRHLGQGLGDACRRRGQDQIEAETEPAHLAAHRPSRLASAGVQRPVEIARDRRVPAGFGVAQQRERLHSISPILSRASCTAPACCASLARTRWIASSSGTRDTRTPGGMASSRRDGVAAESNTNMP